jgi:hypothetical protein
MANASITITTIKLAARLPNHQPPTHYPDDACLVEWYQNHKARKSYARSPPSQTTLLLSAVEKAISYLVDPSRSFHRS